MTSIFSNYGNVERAVVVHKINKAIIRFTTDEGAQYAMENLHDFNFEGDT